MKRWLGWSVLAVGVVALTGCGSGNVAANENAPAESAPAPGTAKEAPKPVAEAKRSVTIPDGTKVSIRTTTAISTKAAHDGDRFSGVLEEPLVVDKVTLAKKGAPVEGVVANSDEGGRVKGVASLSLRLTQIEIEGKPVAVESSLFVKNAKTTKKKDALKVGIGAGIGAAIGALAGGGKGAGIGAASGAGAGTAVVLATHGDPAVVAAESVLAFRLKSPVTVQVH